MKAGAAFTLGALWLALPLMGAVVTSDQEHQRAESWVAAKFEGLPESQSHRAYLGAKLKSGSPESNSRQGHGLRIAAQSFLKGLHCPSVGVIEVHLPAPGTRFQARVGVDSNDITYYSSLGRGSVVVSLEVHGKEVFRSPVMHEGMAAVAIDVNLDRATQFLVRVAGSSDGAQWDQVDLVDDHLHLSDGRELALEDLPLAPLANNFTAEPPFSFVYAGRKSSELLRTWHLERSSHDLDAARRSHVQVYRDPATGLEVRCVAVEYRDFPTVEWTVYFKNTGKTDTPILEDLQALDARFERNGTGDFVLHHNKGAPATPNDYEPYETKLSANSEKRLSGKGGRPSNQDLPYFNLASPGEGVIIVVGWPGQWSSLLARDSGNGVKVRVGQELTHFKLLPGEEVRTPRMVLEFWSGEWIRSQNLWRRWMQAHNMPRAQGQLPPPQMAGNTSREYVEMTEATEADENHFIDRYLEEGLKPEYFWMDAGWYPNNGSWVNTGTWEVDSKRFPNGLRAVSDHAHARAIRTIVWFEPERVTKGSWIYEHHPEWLLSAPPNPGDQLYDNAWRLLDFGNPQALAWITDHADGLISQQGIDLYRQDFNMDPLNFWRAHDAPDRQGITEIHYVTGYLAYWDELRRRHPGMLIDSCASGGRRNDVESMARAVPLTRSDYLLEASEPISQQMQTHGMSLWIPYFGTGISGMDPYTFRSQMTPGIITTWDLRRKELDYDRLRTLIQQWRAVSPNYYGDFYPLTSYSLANDVWAVLEFDRPEAGEGFLEAFRRSASPNESGRFKLQGLDPGARYRVTDLDRRTSLEYSGQELMTRGLEIQLDQAPDSALLIYKRVDAPRGQRRIEEPAASRGRRG